MNLFLYLSPNPKFKILLYLYSSNSSRGVDNMYKWLFLAEQTYFFCG